MSWLKKTGSFILAHVGQILGLLPLVNTVVPQATGVTAFVSKVADILLTVEQMFAAAFGADAKKGSDKLAAAVPFVSQLIQQSDFMVGKKIKDVSAFSAAVTKITSGFADLLNSLGD